MGSKMDIFFSPSASLVKVGSIEIKKGRRPLLELECLGRGQLRPGPRPSVLINDRRIA